MKQECLLMKIKKWEGKLGELPKGIEAQRAQSRVLSTLCFVGSVSQDCLWKAAMQNLWPLIGRFPPWIKVLEIE